MGSARSLMWLLAFACLKVGSGYISVEEIDGVAALKRKKPHSVLLIAYDGVNLIDLSGPMQAFEEASRELAISGSEGYKLDVASLEGGLVTTGTGLRILTRRLDDFHVGEVDTLIVPGGTTDGTPPLQPQISAWIASHGPDIARVCAVCTGAFILADAGMLDERKAATHWRWVGELSERHPSILVMADSIYVKDGSLWTSAGITAGIDLTLALIEEDRGHRMAINIARELVVYLKRSGGQSQYSAPLAGQHADNGVFSDLLAWMNTHLAEDLRVKRLAEIAGMSPRNFARQFTEMTGTTPAKTVERLRIEFACVALEETDQSLKAIARNVGLGDEQNLRRLFQRHHGISPMLYRKRSSGKA